MKKSHLSSTTLVAALATSPLQAATVTFKYDVNSGSVSPGGPAPFTTAVFDDGGIAGTVALTMSVAGAVNITDATRMYLNLDPLVDPESLSLPRDGV